MLGGGAQKWENVGAILVVALLYLIVEMGKGRTRLLKWRTDY